MYNNTFGPVIGDLDGMCDKLNGGGVGGGYSHWTFTDHFQFLKLLIDFSQFPFVNI